MSWENNRQAYCLASTYGLSPPRAVSPVRRRPIESGKFEPDHAPLAENRCMVIANWFDKTNVLVLYEPQNLAYE